MLAYSSSTTAATISRPVAKPRAARDARRVDHRGDAALHVLRAAAVEPAVALARIERRRHALDADGVDVAAEHQRPARRSRPSSTPITFGRPGATSCSVDVEPDRACARRSRAAICAFARRAGHERRIDGIDRDELAQE